MVDCSAVYILNLVYQVDEELHGHWYSISKLYQVSLYNPPSPYACQCTQLRLTPLSKQCPFEHVGCIHGYES